MKRWVLLPALLLAAVLLAAGACSSANHSATPTPTTSTSPTAGRPGGLVGVIDAARLAAVCANAREAETVQSVGGSAVTAPLLAAADLLARPPVDPQAAAAAVAIRRDLRRDRVDLALATTLAFCRSRGG